MPVLGFLALVGLVLIVLLFVADATLEPGSPPIVTGDRVGLPEPWHSDDVQTFAPAPVPDMTSQAVQPQSAPDLATIEPAARAARAQAPHTNKRSTQQSTEQPTDHQQNNSQQNNSADRFSIRGQ